ncbi:hypothetical protein MRX96_005588 [Rhipicephalus microplus]
MGAEESVLTVPVSPAETVVLSRSGTLRRSRKGVTYKFPRPIYLIFSRRRIVFFFPCVCVDRGFKVESKAAYSAAILLVLIVSAVPGAY